MPKIERETIQWPKEKRKEKRIKDNEWSRQHYT